MACLQVIEAISALFAITLSNRSPNELQSMFNFSLVSVVRICVSRSESSCRFTMPTMQSLTGQMETPFTMHLEQLKEAVKW